MMSAVCSFGRHLSSLAPVSTLRAMEVLVLNGCKLIRYSRRGSAEEYRKRLLSGPKAIAASYLASGSIACRVGFVGVRVSCRRKWIYLPQFNLTGINLPRVACLRFRR